MNEEFLDLGSNHTLRFVGWAPDRALNPQYADLPDQPRVGGIITHLRLGTTEPCLGYVPFKIAGMERVFINGPYWVVESWEPLTLSPSVLCAVRLGGCGDHGFIRQGKWVPA